MKVLCFINNLGSGGGQRQLVNIALMLKAQGHTVSFLSYHRSDFYAHLLVENQIEETTLNCANYLDRIRQVRQYLRASDADVVISFLEVPNFLACVAAIGGKRWKLITNELSAKPESFVGLRSKLFKFMERFSDWTVCNSENARKMWIQHYPRYESRLSTIYNPVLMPEAYVEKARQFRRGPVRRLVVAASYQYLKNPVGLVMALERMPEADRARLHIDWFGRREVTLGDTKAYDEAAERIQKSGLEDCITFHGESHEIYEEMAAADAVGLFSTVEGLPNVICEGMLLGKPILMSRVSDHEILVTPENGFTCDPWDPESICQALRDFVNSPDEALDAMGKVSRERALPLFSPDVILKEWTDLMEKLLTK